MVVCYCSKCGVLFYQENGKQFPGRKVSTRTRLEHEKADQLRKLRQERKDQSDADESDSGEEESKVQSIGDLRAIEEECSM
jgi:hypothetical protein